MKPEAFPPWYFDAAAGEARGVAADAMYTALSDGNKPAYQAALARWQAASGGLLGCPGALAGHPWNPPGTDPNATVIGFGYDNAGQFLTVGGVRYVRPA
jgi:hypothetical protein